MAFNPQQLPPPPPPPYPFQYIRHVSREIIRPIIALPVQHAPEESTSALISKLLSECGQLSIKNDSNYFMFSLYNQTVSITQEGTTCGLVALMMALDSLGMTIPEINIMIREAKQLGYTHNGEMYSALNLSKFVEYMVPEVRAIHINNLAGRKHQFIEHLASGWPILIPYDSDRNNYPCEVNAHHAHWAVIIGFCFGLRKPKEMNLDKILSFWQKDSSLSRLYHLESSNDSHLLRDFFNMLLANSSQLYLYAKQCKSYKIHLFDYDQLLKSNLNLSSVGPNPNRDLLIPEGGVRVGLSNQAILIKPKNV